MMINDDDNNNNYFIIITCIIIIYNSINKLYFLKKNNNKKHDSEFFRSMCTRIEIIITMIFLFKKKKQKTIVSRHMQFLHLVNTKQYYLNFASYIASFQSGLELEVLFSLFSVNCAQRQRMSILR